MTKVKNEHYITIMEFMVRDLELSGNELIAYALVYGFSQNGERKFEGSLSYVAKWLNCSKTTACNILNKLSDDGFIGKIENVKNGIKFCDYKADIPDEETLKKIKERKMQRKQKEKSERRLKNLNSIQKIEATNSKILNGHAKKLNDVVQKTLTHNNIDILNEKIKDNTNALSVERASEGDSAKAKKQNRKKEADELFERVWKLYPKKLGKGQVSDTQKLKLLKIGYEELERAVNRCCQYNKDRDMRYWQNGSTFFNSGYVDFLDDNFNGNNEINKKEQPESASGMENKGNELDFCEEFQAIDQSELEDEIIFAAHSFSDKCSSLCLVNKIKDFMFCFIERYAQKTGKSHPMVYPDMLGRIMYIITNKIVINGVTYKPLVTEDANDEAYKKIIDKYFEKNKTNFTLEDFCDKNKIYEMMSAIDWSVII